MIPLVGAIRLAALDGRGISFFDPSPAAAWRNLVLLVPLLLAQAVSDLMALPDGVEVTTYLLLSASVSAVQMTGYMLAVSQILAGTGHGDRFPLFVSTYLWCSIVSTAAGLVALAVALESTLPVANGIGIGLVLWSLVYSWFSVRASVGCPAAVAAGLVVLEILTVLATNALPLQLALAAAKG